MFRSSGVLVYVNAREGDYAKLPEAAKNLKTKAFKTLPMIFVTSSDATTGIQGISYKTMSKDMRDAERELNKKIKELKLLAE